MAYTSQPFRNLASILGEGTVFVSGFAATQVQANKILGLIRAMNGVDRVNSNLVVVR